MHRDLSALEDKARRNHVPSNDDFVLALESWNQDPAICNERLSAVVYEVRVHPKYVEPDTGANQIGIIGQWERAETTVGNE